MSAFDPRRLKFFMKRSLAKDPNDYKSTWNGQAVRNAHDAILTGATDESFERLGRQDADLVAKYLRGGDAVLNIGCGVGRVEKYLAPRVREMWSIDVSGEMIRRAEKRLAGLSNVRLREVGNREFLSSFGAETMDVVFSFLVLQHIEREDAFLYLRDAHRVLKPGGRLFTQFPNLLSPEYTRAYVENAEAFPRSPGRVRAVHGGRGEACPRDRGVRSHGALARRPRRSSRRDLRRGPAPLDPDASAGPACYPLSRIPKRAHSRFRDRRAALLTAAFVLLLALPAAVRAEERATILWKGETHPIGTLGGREFVVSDAARALGLTVATDKATGVLTISGGGHQILLGPGTAQVPVDRRIVAISKPARLVTGSLYAPADFFEKVLFPLAGAAGSWDASKKVWTLVPAGPPPLSIEIAVVHVAPTTQVVFRLSAAAKTATATSEKSFQVRFADTKIDPPFPEKRFEDPLVASVRFAGELATIDFREPGLSARAYPLSSPDRLVVEVGPPRGSSSRRDRARRRRAGGPEHGRRAPDDRGRPGPRRRRDGRDRARRLSGEGGHARDRAADRGDAAALARVPRRAHARLRHPASAGRPDLHRQPREGGPLSLDPRQLLALRFGPGLRDLLPLARGLRQDRPGGREPRERVERRRCGVDSGRRRPATPTSTSCSGTSRRART